MFILPPEEFDTDTTFRVEEALQSLPTTVRAGFERVAKSATTHQAQADAKRARVQSLRDSVRGDSGVIADYDRAVRRGEKITQGFEKQHKAARAAHAVKMAEIKKLEKDALPATFPLNNLVSFAVDHLGTGAKYEHAPVEVKLAKGQTAAAALAAKRAELDELATQRRAVSVALLPLADAEKRIRDDVHRHALAPDASGTTRIRTTAIGLRSSQQSQGNLRWPTEQISHGGGSTSEVDLAFRFLCWLTPESIVTKLVAELKESYRGKTAMSLEEREAKLAELDALRLETEREEEAIVRLLEDGGVTVFRRPNATVEAVLQLRRAA